MKNEGMQTEDNEIGLIDLFLFLRSNRKRIMLGGLVGILLSVAYLALTPKKYEARWQVQMAQFANSNCGTSNNAEEPVTLIQRLRIPTAYSIEVRQGCGMPEDGEFGEYLGGTLKVEATKNTVNVVDMKITGSEREQVKICAEAITSMIAVQQRGMIEERSVGRQVQLVQYEQALKEEQQQLERIKKSELGNFGYLAKLDKLSRLHTKIDGLQEEILLAQLHPARVVVPIYIPSKPIAPKAEFVLLMGFVLGLLLGVLYAIGRAIWGRMV